MRSIVSCSACAEGVPGITKVANRTRPKCRTRMALPPEKRLFKRDAPVCGKLFWSLWRSVASEGGLCDAPEEPERTRTVREDSEHRRRVSCRAQQLVQRLLARCPNKIFFSSSVIGPS